MLLDITDAAALSRPELLVALTVGPRPQAGVGALGLRRRDDLPDGAWLLEGTRRGLRVRIDVGQGLSVTTVGTPGASFRAVAAGGCLHPRTEIPESILRALRPLGPSARWTDLEVVGGGDGVLVARRSQTGQSWPYDLWLAERLIEAARSAPAGARIVGSTAFSGCGVAATGTVQAPHDVSRSC